jgi:hypothetical protein
MKTKVIISAIICLLSISLRAQVGIGTFSFVPNPSAMLEVKSGSVEDPRGFLMPIFDYSQEENRSGPDGLLYYSFEKKKFIYNDATNWMQLNPWTPNTDGSRLLYNPGLSFRVGIGTSDPQSTLDVNGTVTSTGLTVSGAISSTTITSTELVVNSTGAVQMPVGTTAQQPAPVAGMVRFNSDVNSLEYHDGTKWESVVPAGTIVPFAGPDTNVPAGWLLCDGQSVSQSTYSRLFDAIGIAWGDPGGSNFNLPDLRGRFLRGVDNGQGNDPDASLRTALYAGGATGDEAGSYQNGATALPISTTFNTNITGDHYHWIAKEHASGLQPLNQDRTLSRTLTELGNDHNYELKGKGIVAEGQPNIGRTNLVGNHSHTISGGDTETRPKNVYVNFIIKY